MLYEEMSDFEINKSVAEIVTNGEVIDKDDMWPTDNGNAVQVIYKVGVSGEYKDYCNNPADMWPIIELIWDELNYVSPGDDITEWDSTINNYKCGKLRAAAIVFLKMQDAKK